MGAPIHVDIPQSFIDEVKAAAPDRKELIKSLEQGDSNEITRQFHLATDWKINGESLGVMIEESPDKALAYLRPLRILLKFQQRFWDGQLDPIIT